MIRLDEGKVNGINFDDIRKGYTEKKRVRKPKENVIKGKSGRPKIHENSEEAKKHYDCKYIVNRYHTDPEFRERRKEQAHRAYEKKKLKNKNKIIIEKID